MIAGEGSWALGGRGCPIGMGGAPPARRMPLMDVASFEGGILLPPPMLLLSIVVMPVGIVA